MRAVIYVAIGANLPSPDGDGPLATCRAALARLGTLPGLRLATVSRWYESAPVPPSGQPPYVNGVAALRGSIAPAHLLTLLQEIEAAFGRVRGAPNAARTLDLDIVDVQGLVRAAPDPVLPHPRAHERAFVLLPLRDVAPGWVHPASGAAIAALIAALPRQQIAALAESGC